MAKRIKRPVLKLSRGMRKKLMVLFSVVVVLLCALIGRLMYINYTSGERYEKKVLALQSYDSITIPFQRGDIVDASGRIMATSVSVYNVILDCSVLTSNEENIEPTLNALIRFFPELEREKLEEYVEKKPDSKYIVLLKKLPYNDIQDFVEYKDAVDEKGNKINKHIKGVWFEKEYQRSYPYGTLASSVIGFVSSGNVGTVGLENYYNNTLNGINGREYGYLNSDSDFEKTVIAPIDGNTLVSTIDVNIQSIVEKKILEFNETYANNHTTGNGSLNTGVIIMNPNNGDILAMAEYPTFDLNNPRDLTNLMTEEQQETATNEEKYAVLNKLWRNFCVSETYEPGSVQKPFTVAAGLETGMLNTGMSFFCDGGETVNGSKISCAVHQGHGQLTLEGSLMQSCNDALMQMSMIIDVKNFVKYQNLFGFGMKTGIDLPGEASASNLVYNESNMTKIDLATNSFGQNYNCTMIQVASAFSSLINGGTYYQPRLVSKVLSADGGTISVMEPTVLKKTVSEKNSKLIKEYMYNTVTVGTATTAQVDGYSLGGKTGTAEKLPRDNGKYLVSFIGFAPYENPELVIYCVVDEPNSADQAHSYYAQNIVREILEEVYPYMNIFPDMEKTGRNEGLGITGNDPYYVKDDTFLGVTE